MNAHLGGPPPPPVPQVLAFCRRTAPSLLFEDNGNRQQQAEHEAELRRLYLTVTDLGVRERGRRLFLCSVGEEAACNARRQGGLPPGAVCGA